MHSVNGIDLDSDEYEVLVELASSDDQLEAMQLLMESKPGTDKVLESLFDKGLVGGVKLKYRTVFGAVTPKGESFVRDYPEVKREEKKQLKQARAHDLIVAALGASIGYLLSVYGDNAIQAIKTLLGTVFQ